MNHLAGATSPYLRQHAENPVDWYPWGPEALAEAKRRDVPLFVSIGYSACHWCHVMAHESFEDPSTADLVNRDFVAIKVDREERPDLDALYMDAVQAMTGAGGWPLTVFATPDGRPFFGGTYFPPLPRHGTPAFADVLEAVKEAWTSRRGELVDQADQLTDAVRRRIGDPPPARAPGELSAGDLLGLAVARFATLFDPVHGGVGSAPKFPQAPMLELLVRAGAAGVADTALMVDRTLTAMVSGGLYDQLEGGFARYSVDRAWLVPHFEKMLYDQAALARLYLHAHQATGDARWRQVVEETIAYVESTLALGQAGVASSEDADAGGEEGRFSTWTPEEVAAVLGDEEGAAACAFFGVTASGHLDDGRSVLHRPDQGAPLRSERADTWRDALVAARRERVRPGRDDKVVTEWNAMWCSLLAEAAGALGVAAWRARAIELGEMLLQVPRHDNGRWLRAGRSDHGTHLAVAADLAWLVDAFTRLGECTGQARWTGAALEAADQLIELFSAADGGWYMTGADAEPLVVRPRDTYDGVVPSASSVATVALTRLAALVGSESLRRRAERSVTSLGAVLSEHPLGVSHLVWAVELLDAGPLEVVVAGDRPDLVAAAQARFLPYGVLAWGEPAGGPLWEGRTEPLPDGKGVAYVCHRGVCHAPSTTVTALLGALEASSPPPPPASPGPAANVAGS